MDKNQSVMSQIHEVDVNMDNRLEDMVYDIVEESLGKPILIILYVVTMMCRYMRG